MTLRIVSLEEWGGDPAARDGFTMGADVGFAVHWEGVPRSYGASGFYLLPGIESYHLRNGWRAIAYNFAVDLQGQVFECRGWDVANGANGDSYVNTHYLAVCVLAGQTADGSSMDVCTDAAWAALDALYAEHLARGGVVGGLRGHRDLTSTACPGPDIYPQLHDRIDGLLPPPPNQPPASEASTMFVPGERRTDPRVVNVPYLPPDWESVRLEAEDGSRWFSKVVIEPGDGDYTGRYRYTVYWPGQAPLTLEGAGRCEHRAWGPVAVVCETPGRTLQVSGYAWPVA